MNRNIKAPLSDEVAKELKSGDYVYITGTIYTARDAAHKRMWEALEKGEELPIEMKNNIIYYMGPSPAREGRPIGSAGPTTASRMDKYAPKLLDLGLKGMIGKGKRSEQVKEAIVRNGSVYFAAVGGAGAILSKAIKKSEVIAYDDLGTEAIRKLYVEDFPAIVVIDSQGNNLYETAAAVVVNGREALSNVISSQIDLHTLYGGVVPEIASRKHIENINYVIEKALSDANCTLDDIDAIGVTYGPGLVGALLVGVAEAKAICFAKDIPLIGVHHIEGHICANYVENKELEPPFVCLVVSGGHTHLVVVEDYGKYKILGKTRDDAAGEAFDKVARAIGLGYPGGPKIDKISKEGNPHAYEFPRTKIANSIYDFSFSGLKSAVLNQLNLSKMKGEEINPADVAASFQKSVVDTLVSRAMIALEETGMKKFAIAGGVASNTAIRAAFKEECEKRGVEFYHPSPILCTDNAVMIGSAAYYEYKNGITHSWDLNAIPNLKLGERYE